MLAMSDRATDREPEKRAFRDALFGGPAQRVVYAGPDQSCIDWERRSEWLA
jgi:hypothetical protein